jgi:hypothetical protein
VSDVVDVASPSAHRTCTEPDRAGEGRHLGGEGGGPEAGEAERERRGAEVVWDGATGPARHPH